MSATATSYKILIGGEFVDSASGETMDVVAPATGEVIASVPRCSAEDVDRAVAAARAVWPEWSEKTPKDRSELLHRMADVMDEHAEELAQRLMRDTGVMSRNAAKVTEAVESSQITAV